jgi:hypothetical protein
MSMNVPALRVIISALVGAFPGFLVIRTGMEAADPLPNPPEPRAKNHALSLTLHAAITGDGKNFSTLTNNQTLPPYAFTRRSTEDQLHQWAVHDSAY